MDEKYLELLTQAAEYAKDFVGNIDNTDAFPQGEALEGLRVFDEKLPENPEDGVKVIEMLEKYGGANATASIGGRFFGFVTGGLLPVAHAAQWITDTWNQNTALYAMSPVTSKIEAIVEDWIVDLFGLPKGTAMGLVTGSSNGLLCAFAAARCELLRRQGYDMAEKGLRGAPPVRVVLGAGAHTVVRAALTVLGFGREEIEEVSVDNMGRMRVDMLPKLDESTLLILQAGHVNGGSYDPIDEICDKANAAGAWVHVDGAIGLWAAASKKQKHLTKGLEKADSCNVDAHKALNAGYDCGIVLCRHRDALVRALQANGGEVVYNANRDGMLYATEMSRRARAIVIWAVLKTLGRSGVEEMIDKMCDNCKYFAEELKKTGFILPTEPFFNQAVVCLDSNEKTNAVMRMVQESGICWVGGSDWEGTPVIRISVCSQATTREDIDKSVEVFKRALEKIS